MLGCLADSASPVPRLHVLLVEQETSLHQVGISVGTEVRFVSYSDSTVIVSLIGVKVVECVTTCVMCDSVQKLRLFMTRLIRSVHFTTNRAINWFIKDIVPELFVCLRLESLLSLIPRPLEELPALHVLAS